MATYKELYELSTNGELTNKIISGIAVAAHDIVGEAAPSVPRKTWATEALTSPESKLKDMVWYMLGDNKTLSVAQILSAADSAILAAINAAVDNIVE